MIFKNYNFLKEKHSVMSIYNFKVNDLNNNLVDLSKKKNKIILIVNSASG
jgi:glutathione peroxidase-family protein